MEHRKIITKLIKILLVWSNNHATYFLVSNISYLWTNNGSNNSPIRTQQVPKEAL